MAELSREVAKAAREWADQQTDTITSLPPGLYMATVDGTAPLTVSWRNRTGLAVAGKNANYTPTIGDRVHCSVIDDQLLIDYKIG